MTKYYDKLPPRYGSWLHLVSENWGLMSYEDCSDNLAYQEPPVSQYEHGDIYYVNVPEAKSKALAELIGILPGVERLRTTEAQLKHTRNPWDDGRGLAFVEGLVKLLTDKETRWLNRR